MDNYLRKENETKFEHKLRLILLKLDKNIDLDWAEIADFIGENCSGDHLRKTAYGIKEAYEHYQEKIKNGSLQNDFLIDINEKIFQYEKEKIKVRDQKRELNNILRETARLEYIQEYIREVIENNSEKDNFLLDKNIVYGNNKEAMLILSDWHVGLFAHSYWNNFDSDELILRVNELTNETIYHCKNNDVKTIHLMLCGDLISGLIHLTTRINNTEDVIEQTNLCARIIAEMIAKFSDNFEEVKFYNVLGNHDRVTANKKDEVAKESFAKLFPDQMELELYRKYDYINRKNIEIIENIFDDEIAMAEVCGKIVFGVHGHRDKMSTVAKDLTLMTQLIPDYIVMGHTHRNASDEDHCVEIIVNPSLSGVDSYAKEIRKTSKPAQKLLIFNDKKGLECTYSIRLDIKN